MTSEPEEISGIEWIRRMMAEGFISPTGRFRKDIFLPTYLRDRSEFSDETRAMLERIFVGIDFSKLKDMAIQHLVYHDETGLHAHPVSMEEFYGIQGRKPNLVIVDDIKPSFELKDKPVKQNGRSAAYLQFDKTKQHRRMKPTKRRRG